MARDANILYVVTEDDLERWAESPRGFPFKQVPRTAKRLQRHGYELDIPDVQGWTFVKEHFVDSSGFGAPGEAALTPKEFVARLKAGHGYCLTGVGQFQVKVSEFSPL